MIHQKDNSGFKLASSLKALFNIRSKSVWSFFCLFFVLGMIVLSLIYQPALVNSQADKVDQRKTELRNQLSQLQKEINAYSQEIKNLSTEAKTLQRELQLFNNQIKQLQLQIEQSDLAIQEFQLLIEQKTGEIAQIEKDVDSRKQLLAAYLRDIYLYDQMNLIEVVLSTETFSGFFEKIQSLDSIQNALTDNLNVINNLKQTLQQEKDVLEQQEQDQRSLQALQEIERLTLLDKQQEKEVLLSETKGEESIFRKLLGQTQQNIDALRDQLYLLEGIGVSISLSEAVDRAKKVCQLIGIREAFLLAVLKQESSWGKNVGTGNWRRDMRPNDREAFLIICKKLGLNPDQMPVSGKPWYGWGGAMGAAQFLPTTWLAYEADITRLTGHNPPSPWDLEDAFAAAAIKLGRDGASAKTYDTEWKAAMIYFAGSRWNNPLYSFYGDSVMNVARVIQEQIDLIEGKN